MRLLTFLFFVLFFYSCVNDEINNVDLEIGRFEQSLFKISQDNKDSVVIILHDSFPIFNEIFETQIIRRGNMNDFEYANELLAFTAHSDMLEAYDSTQIIFNDISDFKKQLDNAFSKVLYFFPDLEVPNITTFFGGFNYGVIAYEDNIAIGLENFLGYKSKFYSFLRDPDYLRFQKQKKFILSNVLEVFFYENFKNNTIEMDFLSRMIYKGKAMYFIDKMLADVSLEDKFRFSSSEMQWVKENEYYIWQYFMEKELLFSNVEKDFRTFLNYSPFAKGMSQESPGRIAYYIGYNIISSYIKETAVSINQLMKYNDPQKILKDSKYKPRK